MVIGIDVGGTKTVCLLGDDDGRIVASARGRGANLQADGELELEKVLHDAMEQAIGAREVRPSAICLGIAGVDRPGDGPVVHSIMSRIGHKARVLVVNDALIALQAGIGSSPGIVIIAGTGSMAYGRDRHGFAARSGGWGHVLADEGSGYWIGRQALRAVMRQADGRGGATALTPRVLAHFRVEQHHDLIEAVYGQGLKPPAIAALAIQVQQASEAGDGVATTILERAARELADAAAAVTRQLDLAADPFTFLLAGGTFQALPSLRDKIGRLLSGIAPRSVTRLLEVEPAMGAVQFALAETRGGAIVPVYKPQETRIKN